jgi:hypothetical protein
LHTLPDVAAGVVARQAERTGSGLRIHLASESLIIKIHKANYMYRHALS